MCGIAGIWRRDGQAIAPATLAALRGAIAHRGPDAQGAWVAGPVALVHTRLSIIDLDTGEQPLFGPGGSVLIANGEIYNNPELRAAHPEMAFRTHSDCEPPVFLYERDGIAFARHLRGMYAIAIWDPRAERLVLARDPFGIKPLYYAETESGFAFASEPQALLRADWVRPGVIAQRRAELLQLKFTTGAETIFPGIYRVLPGETLVIERARIVERRRLAALPDGPPIPIDRRYALDRLDAVLLDSVSVHLRSDVPYGLFLSGGIDSSALLALMARATGQRIQVITVGYADAGAADESREALRLAKVMNADSHRIEMSAADFWSLAPRVAAAIDDPTADAAVLPTWMLGRAAGGQLKVTLCGEGADELFGGYSRYRRGRLPWRFLARTPRSHGLFDDLASMRPACAHWRDDLAAIEAAAAPDRSPVQRLQAIDCAEWLPNDLLTKLDRCLMVHGVEGRTPFIDPVVADFAFRLPDAERVGHRLGKLLLRAWLARAFPEAGAYARKKGFKPPVGRWMQARSDELARLVAAAPGIAEIAAPTDVAQVFAAAAENSQRAWSLLFYALWHSHHVLGLACEGDIAEVLGEAARASARPQPSSTKKNPAISIA